MTRNKFELVAGKLLERATVEQPGGRFAVLMPATNYWAIRFDTGAMATPNTPEPGDVDVLKRVLKPAFADLISEPNGVMFMGYPCIISCNFSKIAIMETNTCTVYFEHEGQE